MTTPAVRRPSRQFQWAGVEGYAFSIRDEAFQATAQRIAQGVEGQRVDHLGVIQPLFNDFSGGQIRRFRTRDWRRELNEVFRNEGIMTHIPFLSSIGWRVVTQTALISGDYSGLRAANKRVHAVMYNGRFLAFVPGPTTNEPELVKDTSTSSPILALAATADNTTDLTTALWTGMVGTTAAVFRGTDGTTFDIRYTSNPFDDTVTWTEFVTLANAADYVSAGQYISDFGMHAIIAREDNTPSSGNYMLYVSKDASLPVTAPGVVVDAASKDVLTSSSPEFSLTDLDPTTFGNEGIGASLESVGTSPAPGIWRTPESAGASDNVYAHWEVGGDGSASNGVSGLTSWLHVGGFATTTIPLVARFTEGIATIEHKEGAANNNVYLAEVRLTSGGSTIGAPRSSGDELGTTDSTDTVGEAGDDWGTGGQITGEQLHSLGLQIRYGLADNSIAAGEGVDVDHVRITSLKYKLPGNPLFYRSGGFTCGPLRSTPKRFVYAEPADADDETGITQRRILTFTDLELDSDRLVGTKTYPDTGLHNVEAMWPSTGGVKVAGDTSTGVGKQLMHVDSAGEVRQFNFPGFHGTTAVGIVNGFDLGTADLIDVANEDGSDAQWCIQHNGQFHYSYPGQDKSSAISALPLAWAETTHHLAQNRVYRFFPVSTTALAAARSFVPRNIFSDPFRENTSELKQDGPLSLWTPEIEFGPPENENTVNLVRHLGRRISAVGGSYGTVTYEVEVSTDSADIDESFASPDITTGALDSRFEEYLVPASKAFRTAMLKITLDNDGTGGNGSTKSPDALPFMLEVVSGRPYLSRWNIVVDWERTRQGSETWLNYIDRLKDASASNRAQRFVFADIDQMSVLTNWDGTWHPEEVGRAIRESTQDANGNRPPTQPFLVLQQIRGTVS